jgi:hypothetical protein
MGAAATATSSSTATAFEPWIAHVETLLGHSADGDQDTDGYSLDHFSDDFAAGLTSAQAVAQNLARRKH